MSEENVNLNSQSPSTAPAAAPVLETLDADVLRAKVLLLIAENNDLKRKILRYEGFIKTGVWND
jgi:hypothetical protein